MGKQIQTVTGAIAPEQLGRTFSHEHFFFGYPGYQFDYSSRKCVTKEEVIEKCVKDAKVLVRQGMNTVIDGTPMDCGREPTWLKEISEKSGLQIICPTGYYLDGFSATGYWNLRARCGDAVSEYAELLVNELTEGIGDTGIRAGYVKIAIGSGAITEYQKRFIAGAVKAQQETGCVIFSHTNDGELAYELAKYLLWYGADPAKCIIGHMCGQISPARHMEVLDLGFNVGFDRLGLYDNFHPRNEQKAAVMEKLIENGMGDRLLMSQDSICINLGRPFAVPNPQDWENEYFGYINDIFVPFLLENYNISQEDIDRIQIENPKRIYGT